MSPQRQNCPQVRTTALNQEAKKGVILLVDVIHLGCLGDSRLLPHKGDREDSVWNPKDSEMSL